MQEALEQLTNLAKDVTLIDARSFYVHAYALYEAGEFQKAADVFRVLSMRYPLEPYFWFGLASCHQEQRNFKDALNAWAMNSLLDSENPYPHFHAAQCAYAFGAKHDASLAIQEAEKRLNDPSHPLREPIQFLKNQWSIP
jgi:type III secretion system low calcium response chaperone LcrH/SycD